MHARVLRPINVLRAYGKMALRAHEKTNCLTEVMILEEEEKLLLVLGDGDGEEDLKVKEKERPLAGIPVSLKDTVVVKGFDVSVGYSSTTGKPAARDGALVRILRDAGRCCIPRITCDFCFCFCFFLLKKVLCLK